MDWMDEPKKNNREDYYSQEPEKRTSPRRKTCSAGYGARSLFYSYPTRTAFVCGRGGGRDSERSQTRADALLTYDSTLLQKHPHTNGGETRKVFTTKRAACQHTLSRDRTAR